MISLRPQTSNHIVSFVWRYNWLAARLSIDAIMIFREGISPEWEDQANANGGHFQIQPVDGREKGHPTFDELVASSVVLGNH